MRDDTDLNQARIDDPKQHAWVSNASHGDPGNCWLCGQPIERHLTYPDALAAAEAKGFRAGEMVGRSQEYAEWVNKAPEAAVTAAVQLRLMVVEVDAFARGRADVLAVVERWTNAARVGEFWGSDEAGVFATALDNLLRECRAEPAS